MNRSSRGACWKRRRRTFGGCSEQTSRRATALLCVLGILFYLSGVDALFGLTPKRFRYEGLINAGDFGIEDDQLGHVAALGDWNGDSAVDVMTTSADGSTLRIHLWDHATFKFQTAPTATIQAPAGRKIVNVIPGDFNYDGRLDVLLVMSSASSTELEMQIHLGAAGAGVEPNAVDLPASSADAQPFALDATGDMRSDLLGHVAGSDNLKLWRNAMTTANSSVPFVLEDAPLLNKDGTPAKSCHLADPHSSAFIDLDGDCLADIFLVCKAGRSGQSYQIWTASKSSKQTSYTLARQGSLPDGAGALSFADMDRDGTIDVVFPSCDGGANGYGPCYINIAYNKQMPLCSEKRGDWFGVGPGSTNKNDSSSACRDAESNLCVADANFTFDFTVNDKNTQFSRYLLSDVTTEDRLLMTDDLASPSSPIPLVLGDYDRDGYPDIAVITIPKHAKRDETALRILNSVPCMRYTRGCPADPEIRKTRRSFKMMQGGTGAIDDMRDIRRATFFDIDEDGSLDLLLQRLPGRAGATDRTRRIITFVQNNFFYDAFFLKAMTSNGACSSYCDVRKEGEAQYRPWGVNYGGASYKFTVLDPNGVRRAQQVGQLPQTAYQSLQLPYSYFGLGRTNNYVEALFVGVTRRRANNFVELEGVIPNSQVVILPWEPTSPDGTAQDQGDTSTWRRELYLSPGEWIPWVTVVLATIIVMLFGLVFVLHLHEKREDERERKRAVHAINFDAL